MQVNWCLLTSQAVTAEQAGVAMVGHRVGQGREGVNVL